MEGELKAGRYQIGQQIEEGGMGVVFRARDTRLDRPVAFKSIKPEHLHDPQFRARLKREAIAAATITHPGIAQATDYVDDGQEAFIVYEFVEGVTLRKRLAERRFTTEEILEVGIRLADALAAAHEKGFVHRDLKPENVMLTPRLDSPDRVKILDFGLAKRLRLASVSQGGATAAESGDIITTGMVILGTIDYMSPEQVRMEPADHRADIYALGLILYEMATGVNPFRGREPTSTIANILTREPPPLADRSPVSPAELDRIIRKCLRKNREERFQSARDLVVDLTNLRADLARPADARAVPTVATPETPLTISRGVARALFLSIQAGYLAMYIAFARYLPHNIERLLNLIPTPALTPLFFVVAMCGAAVRLYLLSTVGFDYADSGRLFRRVFPVVALLDALWAASPLLLYRELEGLAWVCVVGLAYLPFSQRSLIYSAYAPRGGKSSGVRAGSPA
jgi:serine/threonine protein kinase